MKHQLFSFLIAFFFAGMAFSNECFVNLKCEEGDNCSHYQMLNDGEMSLRFEILNREYKRPWILKHKVKSRSSKLSETFKEFVAYYTGKKAPFSGGLVKNKVVLSYKKLGGLGETKFYIYEKRGEKEGKKPLLIVIPPIYGNTPFDIWQAREYAERGYKVAILDLGGVSFVGPYQPIDSITKSLLKTMGDVHRLIQYTSRHENIDKERIGIFGFSLGGTVASLVFTVNKDIKVLSTVLAGGKFAELMTNSKQVLAALYRVVRKRQEDLSTEAYLNKLKETLIFDPVYFAHLRNPNDVYLVMSDGDSAVPSKNQKELESAFCASSEKGNSRWETGQHFPVIVKDLFKRAKVDEFFDRRLLLP
jgi:dienelactone hydrolase